MRLTSLTASRSSRIHASSETGLRRLRTCWQHGVAPHRRLLDAVHHRRLCRAHCVREVGVPVLTVVRTCRQLAVDRLVGQQHHLVMLRMAVERLAVVVVKLAEMPCECSQRFRIELLARKHEHEVLGPGRLDLLYSSAVSVLESSTPGLLRPVRNRRVGLGW